MGLDLFPDPVGHFELSRRWWYCRRCSVAGGERLPPSPLGWYYVSQLVVSSPRQMSTRTFALNQTNISRTFGLLDKCPTGQTAPGQLSTRTIFRSIKNDMSCEAPPSDRLNRIQSLMLTLRSYDANHPIKSVKSLVINQIRSIRDIPSASLVYMILLHF